MKYKELQYKEETHTDLSTIEKILKEHEFYWIIDAEFDDAIIEIKHNTIIWHSGIWYHGIWEYGIWLDGTFSGKWINGIFEKGQFKGDWDSGIDNSKK